MTDADEYYGLPTQVAVQRFLRDRQAVARAEGLVPQGRQVLRFDAETLDDAALRRLLDTYHRVGLVGQEEALLRRAAEYAATACEVVTGRLVMMAAPTLWDACEHVIADREQSGPVPRLEIIDHASSHDQVVAIQHGLEGVHLAPLPGYFLRGEEGCRAVTLAAVDDTGRIVGSSTVHDLGVAGPRHARTLFSCALWVEPELKAHRLGGWLYAASLQAARDAFGAQTLWSTVAATNEPVIRMLARCHIFPDPRRTYIGLAVPETVEEGVA